MSKETFHQNITHPKEPGSAFTHFLGILMVIFAAFPLLWKAVRDEQPIYFVSLGIFVVSMFLLCSASAIYHTFNLSEYGNRILKKIDHIMIYVLIAGTYTPVCLITLRESSGIYLFFLVFPILREDYGYKKTNNMLIESVYSISALLYEVRRFSFPKKSSFFLQQELTTALFLV